MNAKPYRNLAALLLLLSAAPARATAIVVRRERGELVIGADSATGRWVGGRRIALPPHACKIRQFGGVYFAATGLVYDPAVGLDVMASAESAALQGGGVSGVAARFAARVSDPLRASAISVDGPRGRERMLPTVTAIFAAVEGGLPVFALAVLRIDGFTPEGRGRLRAGTFAPPAPAPALLFLGTSEAAAAYEGEHPEVWAAGSVAGVRELLEVQVGATPATVGPPVDILRLTKDGGEWVQRKEGCR